MKYDDAIIGVTTDGNVVYDFNLMVESLMNHEGMNEADAIEFIEYNTIRAISYAGEFAPVVMYSILGEYA